MCGICGIYAFNGTPVRVEDVDAMNRQMIHRGPDDEGISLHGHVGIAMRRLSIIDLAGGHQPISNEDKTIKVILNGEIYNYIELTKELKDRGHRFYTDSDTEVLVHLYEEHGVDMVRHLNGMFAFALWDDVKKELFLARDRIGIKQLYYCEKGGKLAFSSDMRSLFTLSWVEREPEWQAISDYLTFLYIPAPLTAFKGIYSLPPATIMRVTEERTFSKTYWKLEEYDKGLTGYGEEKIAERFEELLQDSIRLRLRSDVPLGIFLSGGLDSSTLTSFMARVSGQRVRSYSVGFDSEEFCELDMARSVAGYCETAHSELTVTYEDVVKDLPFITWHLAQPLGDSAAVPSYNVSKLASGSVKVLINGAGGDELMAGYHRHHLPSFLQQAAKGAPSVLANALGVFTKRMKDRNFLYKVSDYTRMKDLFLAESIIFSSAVINDISARLPDRLKEHAGIYKDIQDRHAHQEFINRLCAVDCSIYLPDDVLLLLDRTTMALSIEGRVPFLDHRIVEFMQQVPVSMKIDKGVRKAFLRKMMRKKLPESVLTNYRKQGFSGPVETWKRMGLYDICRRLIFSDETRKRGFWNETVLSELLKDKENISGQQVWMLLTLELWMRIFIDSNPIEKPTIDLLKY